MHGHCTLRRSEGTQNPEMPPFSDAELQPRLASLHTSDRAPSDRIDDQYNRALFDNEVLPLLRELKRALAESKVLVPDESCACRSWFAVRSRATPAGTARPLEHFRRAFTSTPATARWLKLHRPPRSTRRDRALSRTSLRLPKCLAARHGRPHLAPLAQCLAEFQPIVRVMYGESPPRAKALPAATEKTAARVELAAKSGGRRPKPQELQRFLDHRQSKPKTWIASHCLRGKRVAGQRRGQRGGGERHPSGSSGASPAAMPRPWKISWVHWPRRALCAAGR